MASSEHSEDLTCSSCLDVFSDLSMLRCGHNFCRSCFDDLLHTQEQVGGDNCPVCTHASPTQPDKQHYLEMHEGTAPGPVSEEYTEIFCTYCLHSSVPAIQSCLNCEASLCAVHLHVHTKSSEHILTKPTKSFEESKCSLHKKILDYYCSQDKRCICILCCLQEHRGHQVCHFKEAFEKIKEKRDYALEIVTSEIEEIEKRVQGVQDRKVNVQGQAADVVERVSVIFRDLRRQQEDLEKRILSDISCQEQNICLSISNRIQHLEENRNKLSRKMRDMEELSETPDPLLFYHWMKPENNDLHKLKRNSSAYRKEDVTMAYALQDFDEAPIFQSLYAGLLDMVTSITRGIYIQEASDLLLDVNTAANNVAVSEDFKELSCPGSDQCRIEKEKRFDFSQALSIRTFRLGRYYWDVEVGESGDFRLGVACSSIGRKGGEARIGNNDKSWCLGRESDTTSVIHDTQKIPLEHDLRYQKIRTYLDYEAGQISFYELGDSIRHLHTFTATFTEPLHAAFCVFLSSWVRILS